MAPMFDEKQFDENFYVLRDPDRQGVIVMGPPGEELGADMIELDEAFRRGALWLLLDAETGRTIDKGFVRGDCDFPASGAGERLCLVSADPFDFDIQALSAMVEAEEGGDLADVLPSDAARRATDFMAMIREADLDRFRLRAPSEEPDL
ncbi:hypothetical protein LCGC14_0044690 [marine sediment metagenome]